VELPGRPEQHVTGDRGVLAVRAALPPTWVSREQSADYGIDIEIELAGDVVTGRIFKGQVRAHDRVNWTLTDTYQQSTKARSYNYWREFSVPVVLFLVDVEANLVYWAPPPVAGFSTGAPASITVSNAHVLPATAHELERSVLTWVDARQSLDVLNGIPALERRFGELEETLGRDFFLFLGSDELAELEDVYACFARLSRALGEGSDALYPWPLWLARSRRAVGDAEPLCYGVSDEVVRYLIPVRSRLFEQARQLLAGEDPTPRNLTAYGWACGWQVSFADDPFDSLTAPEWDAIDMYLESIGAQMFKMNRDPGTGDYGPAAPG